MIAHGRLKLSHGRAQAARGLPSFSEQPPCTGFPVLELSQRTPRDDSS
jgi:hypothetical protein